MVWLVPRAVELQISYYFHSPFAATWVTQFPHL